MMPKFLAQAASFGARPKHLRDLNIRERLALVARLKLERNVARFIVAPAGFGKTSVMLEYAEEMFSWNHVSWVRGDVPSFLRDLDDGVLFEGVKEADPDCKLVVFDDVPSLDDVRRELFASAIDRFLASECEVLVSCTCVADSFECLSDRTLVTASDLLLSDEELELTASASPRRAQAARSVPRQQRVVGLAWGTSEDAEPFLKKIISEGLSCEFLFQMFLMLMLHAGRLDDLSKFGRIRPDVFEFLAKSYPFLGIDELSGTFETAPFGTYVVAKTFSGRLQDLADRSCMKTEKALVDELADMLLEQDEPVRAADVVRLLDRPEERALWLAEHEDLLLDECCLIAASSLYATLSSNHLTIRMRAGEAVRQTLLGWNVRAVREAKSAILSAETSQGDCTADAMRAAACLLVNTIGEAHDVAAVTAGNLVESASEAGGAVAERACALSVGMAVERSASSAAGLWLDAFDGAGGLSSTALFCGAWVLDAAAGANDSAPVVEAVATSLATAVNWAFSENANLTLPQAIAALSFANARASHIVALPPLSPDLLAAARRIERMLQLQCISAERERRLKIELVARRRIAARDPRASAAGKTVRRPPELTVNLLGGMEVRIGGKKIDAKEFHRKKVRLLLAMLVMHRGHCLSRHSLAEQFYPGEDIEQGMRNVSSLKSKLVKILKTPDNNCPYIITEQGNFGLDASLLRSDIFEVNAACEAISRGSVSDSEWSCLITLANDPFADDILPGDAHSVEIERDCTRYREKIVDALMGASELLMASGRPRDAVLFARAANDRDETREDTYLALIKAQYAALQINSAIETYMRCRKYLSEELGMDPSPRTVRLYHKILNREEIAFEKAELLL